MKKHIKERTKRTIYITAILLCSNTYSVSCFAYDDEGFQLWSAAGACFVISNEWKGKFEEEFRLGNNGGKLNCLCLDNYVTNINETNGEEISERWYDPLEKN